VTSEGLLAQEVFVREVITESDTLVVAMGWNDLVLRPTVQVCMSDQMTCKTYLHACMARA
jgi:hypothetical protein